MCLSRWKVLFWLGANSSLKKWCVAQVLTSGARLSFPNIRAEMHPKRETGYTVATVNSVV